ncbi:MAG: hypothetical protein JO306_13815, partial [Gemmatimonadetes bacterium]|nr:hypothetical protein [Gemmatimonadota bacterium]
MLKPVRDLLQAIAKSFGESLGRGLVALPMVLARSVPLARTVVLGGFALLSLGMIAFTLRLARVQEAIRANEEYARDTSRDLELWFAGVQNMLKLVQATVESHANPEQELARPGNGDPLERLLALSDATGIAVLVNGQVRLLRGSLDSSMPSPAWNNQRWRKIGTALEDSLGSQEVATVFLGMERLYRTQKELAPGQPLSGSFVVARAWRDPRLGWIAVAAVIPLSSVESKLHLSDGAYRTGNYDYLVGCDGWLMVHPHYELVAGTLADGSVVSAAGERADIGKHPLNTRDSDFIAGGAILNNAFNAMVKGRARSVVYKNLTGENRLTSFRRLDLTRVGIRGCAGLVAGHGLDRLEAVITPLLLDSPAALGRALNLLVLVYGALLSGWIAFTMRIRSLQDDLLAWGGYMSEDTAAAHKLLPIANRPSKPRVLPDMVGLVVTIDAAEVNRSSFAELLDALAVSVAHLKADNWIVHHWSLHSVFICRPLNRGGTAPPWTPTAVVDYFPHVVTKDGEAVRVELPHSRCRISYAIGDLRIRAYRTGAGKAAVVSLSGTALTHALELDDSVSRSRDPWGSLVYLAADADACGFAPAGQAVVQGG